MKTTRKYTKPSTPLTEKVWTNINAKTNSLLRVFRDFGNKELHVWRRNDATGRLAGAAAQAYAKFCDNDTCSFDGFANIFILSEYRHCIRDYWREIARSRATVSCDVQIFDDGEVVTFKDKIADARDRNGDDVLRHDIDEALAKIRRTDRRLADALGLYRDGYKLNEIASRLSVGEREFYDVIWPDAKSALRRILEFRR